ncbi:lysophospholipid acyltransferase family protein [Lentzea indica]|uniref:lysophospholipid acyltransferase family protein n=1 Tax=Lentzea indica TaxID=2604800 RepID=UPI00143C529D|nr:lysophospholipid acyltransferase family protein [Lentzea indica]
MSASRQVIQLLSPWQIAFAQGAQLTIEQFTSRLLLRSLRGVEALLETRSGVLVSNHPSMLDHLAIGTAVKLLHDQKVYFLSKEKLHQSWLTRRLWHESMGSISIGGRRLTSTSLRACLEVLESGNLLCIYPEGGKFPNGTTGQFFSGAFRIARMARCPVTAVTIGQNTTTSQLGRFPALRQPYIDLGFQKVASAETVQGWSKGEIDLIAASVQVDVHNSTSTYTEVTPADVKALREAIDSIRDRRRWSQRLGERATLSRHARLLEMVASRMDRVAAP